MPVNLPRCLVQTPRDVQKLPQSIPVTFTRAVLSILVSTLEPLSANLALAFVFLAYTNPAKRRPFAFRRAKLGLWPSKFYVTCYASHALNNTS